MAWTAPKTFTANSTLTAADLNTYLRDNLLETSGAKAQTPGGLFVSNGANSIAERIPTDAMIATQEGTTSTTFVDLATVGPSVSVVTGSQALVFLYCDSFSATVDTPAAMSYAVSGATTIAVATDSQMSVSNGSTSKEARLSAGWLQKSLNPGTNVFTAKYKNDAASGTVNFKDRRMAVIPL